MYKVLTIIGERPQIIKAAAISRAIRNKFADKIKEIIVYTGQHDEKNMSQVFFDELEIPKPDYSFQVDSGLQGKQTALMIEKLEEVLIKERPNALITFGDSNSTLAASIVASKLSIPIAHVEAGLRSHNRSIPEEINRVVCDHLSTMLFCPTAAGFNNLIKEGFDKNILPPFNPNRPKIYHCGDVMYDNSLYFTEKAELQSTILQSQGLKSGLYILATVHRNTNTEDPKRLSSIFSSFDRITREGSIQLVIPMHPWTSGLLKENITPAVYESVMHNTLIKIIPPVSFLDMIMLEKNARLIITDSGGVQKESYFFKKPCIVLRSETEWTELVDNGNNVLAGLSEEKIITAWKDLDSKTDYTYPSFYGDGRAGEFMCGKILSHLGK